MDRTWTDPRDGKTWDVRATPLMQTEQPGEPTPMMTDVPWNVWFEAEDAARRVRVTYAVGSSVETFSDAELQRLLDRAR